MSKPLAFLSLLLAALPQGEARPVSIAKNTTFTQKKLSTPIVIDADDITIDGGGAVIDGPGQANNKLTFQGDGLSAKGRKNVIIKNLTVRGFKRGVYLDHCEGFRFENCNISDNYTDPSFGWGEFERAGGFILDFVNNTQILNCKAKNNWNGIDLYRSDSNKIINSDASRCSNVCLKMETSSDNDIQNCNLSYGIRVDPGETHARDSTCVLMESGSDRNRFTKNDITHGGDGVFIRVLNGWMSQGNVFTENDCSYANNNGFESWSQGNSYYRNKANYCSYGFWLGGSDKTVLEGNEAAWNGLPNGNHNAPESGFTHGGIVIVHGTGSHTLIDNNYCHDNNGGGIVFQGDLATKGEKWKMHHLIVQRNRLENNKWGIYARYSDAVWLLNNQFKGNAKETFIEDVSNLTELKEAPADAARPVAKIDGAPAIILKIGETLTLDASASADPSGKSLTFLWTILGADWKPKVNYSSPSIRHVFTKTGFYRIGVTVSNGALADLAWRDCYVLSPEPEVATEGGAARWKIDTKDASVHFNLRDADASVAGSRSVAIRSEDFAGGSFEARLMSSNNLPDFSNIKKIFLWIKFENANIGGFGGANPIVTLYGKDASLVLTPVAGGAPRNLLMDLVAPETRDGWVPIEVDLDGAGQWSKLENFEGDAPAYYNTGFEFRTVNTPIDARGPTSLVSAQNSIFAAAHEHDRIFRSVDGGLHWGEVKNPSPLGDAGLCRTQSLVCDPKGGAGGMLYLRREAREKDKTRPTLAAYDIAKDEWTPAPTFISITHGACFFGRYIYGIAHARMGNYGGGICRISVDPYKKVEDRTMFAFAGIPDGDWYGAAAQLLAVDKRIYGIKNDWTTPRPEDITKIGDRLFDFDPDLYKPSLFAGGDPDATKNWREVRTPVHDLGVLPFEIGRGASMAALPPRFCEFVGAKGGLFIIAGCSPSNHEGDGAPSKLFTIYDIEKSKFTVGELPGETGAGTSVAFHDGSILIKRGGLGADRADRELWMVKSLQKDKYESRRAAASKRKFDPSKVESIGLRFESAGGRPVALWIDGLQFVKD